MCLSHVCCFTIVVVQVRTVLQLIYGVDLDNVVHDRTIADEKHCASFVFVSFYF